MTNTFTVDHLTGRGLYTRDGGAPSPNFLFITYDMVPREFWEPTAEERSRGAVPATPAIDELSAHGSFGNAWCTSPLCSPSRASIFTGRHSYITTNGERAHDGHDHELRPGDTIFQEYLRAAGYRTRHAGKCHVGPLSFTRAFGGNDRIWDRWSPPWYDDDDYKTHLERLGLKGFRFLKEIYGKTESGGKGNSTGGWVQGNDGEFFPESATYTAFTADSAIRGLDNMLDSGKPFYQQVDFFEPHQPFCIPGGLEERERELRKAVRAPESWKRLREALFAPGKDSPRVYDVYRKYWGFTDEETVIDYLVAHILQFEVLERQTMRILDHLKKRGVWDDTIVVLTADHGEMNCEEALVDKGAYLNPRVLRVPLLAKGILNDVPLGTSSSFPVSLVDIAPTLLGKAGIRIMDRHDGVDLAECLAERRRPPDKPVLFEVWTHVIPNPAVGMLLTDEGNDYCYIFNAADSCDELYRKKEDGSWPLDNLIHAEGMLPAVSRIQRLFHARLEKDPRWISWLSFFRLRHRAVLETASFDMQLFVE